MRRGNISVPGKFGDKVAVLAGDYLYALAVNIAVKDGDKRILNIIAESTNEMVKGELYQIEYSNIDKITEEHYYSIIERKTGRLMAASTTMGAIKGGCTDSECDEMYNLGLEVGYAFQIVDDTLDFSDSAVTGKDAGNDFKDGKITLPFIYVLANGKESEKEGIIKFAKDPDEAYWPEVKKIVTDSGALDYSFSVASDYAVSAEKRLESFPDSVYKRSIKELISFIVDRKY
jgi:octaprenyl-diphosphate synthase